ncbi:hypothetical protein ACFQ5N_02280 [Lutibacter holmesii]|uniref:Uncharacterized protein n=1 Tax=Lutibacter holmesii TaxID=1137985 RepID=A0ABW3WKJ6_9FLAO
MKTTTIYTNGKSLFTLEDFGKTAGISHPLNITFHSEIDSLTKKAMHEKGQLHYVFGTGDRKELANVNLKRGMKLKNFEIF